MAIAHEESDADIVARVVGGDINAYARIMQRYEAKLQRYVVFLLHDEFTAQDVVQETFITAYRNLTGYNPSYKFSSWIYRIAHNQAMNAVKKQPRLSYDEPLEPIYDPELAQALDARLAQQHIQSCVAGLKPKYRDVIQLIFFEKMKYQDAADVLHIPTATVGVWLLRAKRSLAAICQKKGVRP